MATRAPRAQPEQSVTLYIVERELSYFVHLCHHPLHWLSLLTRAICIEPCHSSYIFVPHLAFCVHFAYDLNRGGLQVNSVSRAHHAI